MDWVKAAPLKEDFVWMPRYFSRTFTGTTVDDLQWAPGFEGLSWYLPTEFLPRTLDGTGLYQGTPSNLRDTVDRIWSVDWRRSVDRYCCQERGQVLRIDHRKHLSQSCKYPPSYLGVLPLPWDKLRSAVRGRICELFFFYCFIRWSVSRYPFISSY